MPSNAVARRSMQWLRLEQTETTSNLSTTLMPSRYASSTSSRIHASRPGLTTARCWQRSTRWAPISVERLSSRHGFIGPERIQAIDQALRFVLDL